MTQLVQLSAESRAIGELFKKNQQRMIRAAPRNVDPARLLAVAFNAIAYNSDLLQCTKASLIGGVFEALKMGLTLGGPMQEAWLIPFRVQGTPTATLIVGYQGYRNLIDRGRAVVDLHPRAVHNGVGRNPERADEFDYFFGDTPRIIHRPCGAAPEKENQVRAVYAVAKLRGGGVQMEVLEKEEIDAHRKRSRAANSGPWVTDYPAMGLKTAIRKIAKYLPKTTLEMQKALELDDKADLGQEQDFDLSDLDISVDTVGTQGPQPQKGLEGVKDTLRTEQGKTKEKAPVPTAATSNQPAAAAPPAESDIDWGAR